jgi:hypothetical protein
MIDDSLGTPMNLKDCHFNLPLFSRLSRSNTPKKTKTKAKENGFCTFMANLQST